MKYSYENLDERIVKTKLSLSGAILNLIGKNKTIKVLDICHKANITPMTYYHHFGNKQELLEFSIKEQLYGILPIPQKLKPTSLKHLIYYLIFSLNKFITNNRDLLYCAIRQAYENKYIGSYFDLVSKIIRRFIKQEVVLLIKTNN
ncbi:MAG: TetR/AcrR family transcriptional regulator [Mycoplasmoidaceae bacterium]|nr:TetR/AcrR family transcriptional regulator [Mycoplasmoidaceae bacterium]